MSRRTRTALVTGAGRGIGARIATELAHDGYAVVVVARSTDALRSVVAEIEHAGGRALAVPCDITDETAVAAAVSTAAEAFGGIDVVINNAGTELIARLEETTIEQWRHVMAVNVEGTFLVLRQVAPHLFASGSGRVINISSIFALSGASQWSAYSAAKGAVLSLTRTLAVEWARHGVRVNAVLPGNIETEMTAPALADPKLRAYAEGRTPMRRIGLPADIAPLVRFLASEDADFVTGQAIAADGGFLAW